MIKTRTKIIASLGPSSSRFDVIVKLAEEGVSGFRLNFAHGGVDTWKPLVEDIRRCESLVNRPLTLIGDLQGASIRLGVLDEPIELRRGDNARIVACEEASARDKVIPLPVKEVFEGLEIGDVILMDDGRVRLKVVDVSPSSIEITALTDAVIRSRKALAVLNKEFDLPAITEKDLEDLKFALGQGFDYISLSYVRSSSDIELLRSVIRRMGFEDVRVIAKVETKSAINNLEEVIAAADVVLVARGDLGMILGLEEVPHLQKTIVEKSISMGKPVIIATQLLESMIENPVPTRAEVVDVNTAISEGVDALMLTGETAVGKYPVEAVRWLRRIIGAAEDKVKVARYSFTGALGARYAKGVIELAEDLNAKLVIYSVYGNTARLASLFRPSIELYVGTPSRKVLKHINVLWGVRAYHVEADSYDSGLEETYKLLKSRGEIRLGDLVVLTYGLRGEDEQVIKVRRVSG